MRDWRFGKIVACEITKLPALKVIAVSYERF